MSPASPTSSHLPARQFVGLELFRLLCAVSVIAWHYQHFWMVSGPKLAPFFSRSGQPFAPELMLFYRYGFLSVQLFWEISGFIFVWKYAETIRDHAISGWRFFVLRFSRLYPLHFATLLIVAVLQSVYVYTHHADFVYVHNDLYHFVLQLFFASHWGLDAGDSFNGPIWSISLEVLIYLLFFLAARTLRLSALTTGAIILVLFVGTRLYHWAGGPMAAGDVLACASFFFSGGLVYFLSQGLARAPAVLSAPIAAAAALALGIYYFRDGVAPDHRIVLMAFGAALLVLFQTAPAIRPLGPIFDRLAPLGNMTYSSYLVHFPMQLGIVLVLDALGVSRHIFASPFAFLAYIASVLVIGLVVHARFEMPAQNWLRRFLLPRPAALKGPVQPLSATE